MAIGQLGPLGNLEFGEGLSETVPPFLSGQTPAPSATGVLVDANVQFTIDDADSGVLLSSVIVEIDSGSGFVTAYTGEAFQSGFSGTATPSGIGFAFDIAHTVDWPGTQLVQVRVQATDVDGNALDTTYSFTTQNLDALAPTLTAQTPAPSATGVAVNADINFTVTDDVSGVNLATVTVSVDTGSGFVTAYTGGSFQSGFTGSANVNGLGYDFVVNPNVDFPYNGTIQVRVQATDNASNSLDTTYSFMTVVDVTAPFLTAQTPAPGATGVAVNSNINVTVQDAVSGVVLSSVTIRVNSGAGFVIAYTSSAFQAGFAGSATPSGLGYAFVINPDVDFPEAQLVQVRVEATDNASNSLDTTYSFTSVDTGSPVILNKQPTKNQHSVPTNANIQFRLDDPAPGLGIDQTTINVTIDQGSGPVNAVVNGSFVAPFNGPMSSITPVSNGFDVVVDPEDPLVDDTDITVVVSAEDFEGNSLS